MSGVILLIGALSFATKQLNFGIDFESRHADHGGARQAGDASTTCATRSIDAGIGLGDAEIQEVDEPGARRQRLPDPDAELGPDEVSEVAAALDDEFGVEPRTASTSDQRRADVRRAGRQQRDRSRSSSRCCVICAYVAFRFEPKYAVPVLIALIHDILITAGVYSLTGREVTSGDRRRVPDHPRLLALRHDHRVRPNPRERAADAARGLLADRQPLDERGPDPVADHRPLDRASWSRCCCIFGGETLKDFAFAMMVGIASGTYSSIFIASPVLTALEGARARLPRAAATRIEEQMGYVPAFPEDNVVARVDEVERRRRGRGCRRRRRRRRRRAARGAGAGRGAGRRRPTPATATRADAGRADRRGAGDGVAERAERRRRAAAQRAARKAQRRSSRKRRRKHGRRSLDGAAGLVHDGRRALALHRLRARPLLGRDRRRVPRRDRRARWSSALLVADRHRRDASATTDVATALVSRSRAR